MEANESILVSVKKLLGIDESYKQFDQDILIHINTVLSVLTQLGVGPIGGLCVMGDEETWSDFIVNAPNSFAMVKTYVYLKVKLLFDPPLSSAAVDSINQQVKEFEWRLSTEAELSNTGKQEGRKGEP